LNNIGAAYNSISQPQEALKYYNQALPIMREVAIARGSYYFENIGSAVRQHLPTARSIEIYNQALPIRREVGDRAGKILL
jgi:tetratricopeptide (TPR) repeat protein